MSQQIRFLFEEWRPVKTLISSCGSVPSVCARASGFKWDGREAGVFPRLYVPRVTRFHLLNFLKNLIQ